MDFKPVPDIETLILTNFGYPPEFVKTLSLEEKPQLYLAVLEYVWGRILKTLNHEQTEQIYTYLQDQNYTKVFEMIPDYLNRVKTYGRTYWGN